MKIMLIQILKHPKLDIFHYFPIIIQYIFILKLNTNISFKLKILVYKLRSNFIYLNLHFPLLILRINSILHLLLFILSH